MAVAQDRESLRANVERMIAIEELLLENEGAQRKALDKQKAELIEGQSELERQRKVFNVKRKRLVESAKMAQRTIELVEEETRKVAAERTKLKTMRAARNREHELLQEEAKRLENLNRDFDHKVKREQFLADSAKLDAERLGIQQMSETPVNQLAAKCKRMEAEIQHLRKMLPDLGKKSEVRKQRDLHRKQKASKKERVIQQRESQVLKRLQRKLHGFDSESWRLPDIQMSDVPHSLSCS